MEHFKLNIKKLVLLISINISAISSYSQEFGSNKSLCDSLSKISSKIWKQKNDSAKLAVSEAFFTLFQSMLNRTESYTIAFDSINGISRVVSDDNNLRIFTWNIPLADGSNRYFGMVQMRGNARAVIPLRSSNPELNVTETMQISESNWYGALYYKIIQQQNKNKIIYTLLGWDGFNAMANRKIIDILSFDENGNIVFGQPIFKTAEGIKSRIVFEYAEKANMLLRHDYQAIRIEKRKRIQKENTWLIVMDRLIPVDPTLKGIMKYYVPAGDVYDGFIFRDGFWVLVEDIEAANK